MAAAADDDDDDFAAAAAALESSVRLHILCVLIRRSEGISKPQDREGRREQGITMVTELAWWYGASAGAVRGGEGGSQEDDASTMSVSHPSFIPDVTRTNSTLEGTKSEKNTEKDSTPPISCAFRVAATQRNVTRCRRSHSSIPPAARGEEEREAFASQLIHLNLNIMLAARRFALGTDMT